LSSPAGTIQEGRSLHQYNTCPPQKIRLSVPSRPVVSAGRELTLAFGTGYQEDPD